MYKVIDKTIYMNRGDAANIHIVNKTQAFENGDFIIFSVCEEGNLENTLFTKKIYAPEGNNTVDITLDPSDTRSFCESFKNGQKTFWYEIELNEEITLIGYDKDGPKLLILYPEAAKTITSV